MARVGPEGEGGGGERVSRSQLFGRIGTAFSGGAGGDGGEDAGGSASIVSGVIIAVEPRTLRLETSESPVVAASIDEEATLWRLGAARLSDYVPGDYVVVEGRWEDGKFIGSSVEAVFRVVSGELTARSGSRLETEDAAIRLTEQTRANASMDAAGRVYAAKPLDELAVGDEVFASGLLEPRTGELTAAYIGARAD